MDEQTKVPCVLKDFVPIGTTAQKLKYDKGHRFKDQQTNRQTDRPTHGLTYVLQLLSRFEEPRRYLKSKSDCEKGGGKIAQNHNDIAHV